MTSVDMMEVARIMREVAAEEIMPRWRNLAKGDVTSKAGAGLVTVADHAAEAALEARLKPLVPGSSVIGEEAVAADPTILERFHSDEPTWVLDPIDGTRTFADGSTTFDVMVALVIGMRPVAGWIYAPAEDTLYLGEAGGGAEWHRSGTVSRIAAPVDLPLRRLQGIVSPGAFTNRGRRDPRPLESRFKGFVRHSCSGHNYGRLFSGESQFMINFSTFSWDHLPGLAIAEAAGFTTGRHDGAPFDPLDVKGGILVAPDRASWDEISRLLLSP